MKSPPSSAGSAGVDQWPQRGKRGLDGPQAGATLDRHRRVHRRGIRHHVRRLRIGREVHVGDGRHAAGARLHEQIASVGVARVEQGPPRQHLVAHVVLRPAERAGQAGDLSPGLLDEHDVRGRALDHLDGLAEVDEVAPVLDVEHEDLLRDRSAGQGKGGSEGQEHERTIGLPRPPSTWLPTMFCLRLRQPPRRLEGPAQDELDLRVHAAQVVARPALERLQDGGVDAEQEGLALGQARVSISGRGCPR